MPAKYANFDGDAERTISDIIIENGDHKFDYLLDIPLGKPVVVDQLVGSAMLRLISGLCIGVSAQNKTIVVDVEGNAALLDEQAPEATFNGPPGSIALSWLRELFDDSAIDISTWQNLDVVCPYAMRVVIEQGDKTTYK